MKATSLSINLVGGCNARCPFCIASATWKTGHRDNRRLEAALPRAFDYARYHGVDTVLITGSGEPTLHRALLLRVATEARRVGIPAIEVQTNAGLLAKDPTYLGELAGHGVTTVALSVASVDPQRSAEIMALDHDYLAVCAQLDRLGFLCRISLNLVEADRDALLDGGLARYANQLAQNGVRQLTLRELGVPDRAEDTDDARQRIDWVQRHRMCAQDVEKLRADVVQKGTPLRALSYGARVFDYCDLSVVVTTCLSETTDADEIRSIILQPDGHIYHSWNYRGSVLL